jgi:hypothetical protein
MTITLKGSYDLEEQCESKEVVFSFWLVLSQLFFSFDSVYKLKGLSYLLFVILSDG